IVLVASSSSHLPVTVTLVSGAASLSGNVLTGSGGNVHVRATQSGDEAIAAAEPVERTYSFIAGSLSPFITSPPLDQAVVAGGSATLRATAIGTPAPAYQWQKDGAVIPGATTTTLTFPAATLADAARYTIVATNPAGNANASATLTVRTAPTITAGPASQTIFAGEPTTFGVTATGVPAPTLQWRKNGTVIPGATNATLSFASAVAGDAGRYDVVATNLLGAVTSAAATLAVNTRDFSGTYFGAFTDTTGSFALHVRPDRTGVFLAHLPALQTGLVVTDVRVDLSGNFSVNTITVASDVNLSPVEARPEIAAAPQPVTLRGLLNDATGSVSGTVSAIGASFEGTRASRTGPAAPLAGLYRAALIGSANGRGYVMVAPDAQAYVLSASDTALDSSRGTVDEVGRLVATSASQVSVELTLANGALNGVMRSPSGATGVIAGVLEGRAGTERLANFSMRAVTSPGTASLITGFVVSGTAAKQVLIRAAGPALAVAPFNIANAVSDPTLQLFRGNTSLAQNNDWGTPAANVAALNAAITRAGAFPFRAGSRDAALLMTLPPGAYSVVVAGGTGTALAEVYEVLQNNEVAGARRLVNASARGLVSPASPFIAGFVVTGTGPQRVLIRGIGPRLGTAPFNVAGVLPNPQLSIFKGSAVIKSNDDWFRDPDATLIRDAAVRARAFALGATSLDAAVLLFLEPGAYTAQVMPPANASAANSSGLVLIEIYESPLP
ncbi:MAG: immunoglobulin domain-containing protein, partial [Opitutaceae bacterium]